MIRLLTRTVLISVLVFSVSIFAMMLVGSNVSNAEIISIWSQWRDDAFEMRWDLRSHINAIADERPLGGVLSPDGATVVTADYMFGQTWLYRSEPHHTERTLIGRYDYEASITPLLWTADSAAIVIVDTHFTMITRIVHIDIASGESTIISEQNIVTQDAEWSPDGRHVLLRYFQSNSVGARIRVVNIETGQTRRFPLTLESHWSPDGHYIAYQTLAEPDIIQIYDTYTGDTQTEILPLNSNDYARSFNMVWSPDSRKIAFAFADSTYEYEITSNTINPLINRVTRLRSWSPDGETLALHILERSKSRFYLLNNTNHELIPMLDVSVQINADIAWSPDGRWLMLSEISGDTLRVEIIDTLTGNLREKLQYTFNRYRPYRVNDTLLNWWIPPQ